MAEAIPAILASRELLEVRRQFDIFGLHAARLDLREDSARLTSALGELLRALNLDLAFEQGDDAARSAALQRLLAGPVPRLSAHPGVTVDTAETWDLFRLIARVGSVYGRELLGPFIISMTRGPADPLTVLLLAKWANCADGLSIVPLFETVDDLEAAPRILAELFGLAAYRRHLSTCGDEQMIMIGYSDSNKDSGYLAANWALYQAQAAIATVCREHGIAFTLFHGRGGTVARGGGPDRVALRRPRSGSPAPGANRERRAAQLSPRGAQGPRGRRTRSLARLFDGHVGAGQGRIPQPGLRHAWFFGLLEGGDSVGRDQPAAHRFPAGGTPWRQAGGQPHPRHPLGVFVDAKPLQPAGLVWVGHGAGRR